jgi:hypothetical protein
MSLPVPSLTPRIHPREIRGDNWLAQAAFWARAVAAVQLLAGGAVLLFADWSFGNIPVELYLAIAWAAPAPIYILLSFFLRKRHGFFCIVVAFVAIAHAFVALVAPVLIHIQNREALQWYYLIAFATVGGEAILAVCCFQTRKWLLEPISTRDHRRGFDILPPGTHSIVSDRKK